jgi:hypothetical protein
MALLVQLTLTGQIAASEHSALGAWREAMQARLQWFDAEVSGLAMRVSGDDIDTLGDDPTVRQVAQQLAALSQSDDGAKSQAAKAALAKLFELARQIGGAAL